MRCLFISVIIIFISYINMCIRCNDIYSVGDFISDFKFIVFWFNRYVFIVINIIFSEVCVLCKVILFSSKVGKCCYKGIIKLRSFNIGFKVSVFGWC